MNRAVQLAGAALVAAAWAGNLGAAEPQPLQPGDEVRGEITSAAALNHSDGTRSRLYLVEIGERELVSFDVSGPLRAQLSLFDGEQLVGRTGDRHASSLSLRAPRSATYTLAVSGADASAYGPYTLRADVVDGWDGRTLRSGDEVLDWVDGSRQLPLRVERRAMYTIDLRSDQFDALLKVAGGGVDAQDDDGGEGTDSRLRVLLEPGDYTLTVGGWGGSGQGLYRLAVASQAVPANLSQGGPVRTDGRQLQGIYQGQPLRYRFSIAGRRLVTADMRSGDFDSLLVLRGQGVEHYDDDGGEGLDARLSVLLEPGEYTLDAGAAVEGSGLFALTVSATDVPEGIGGGRLAVGEARDALLLAGAVDRHTVEIAVQGDYVFDMASDEFDSYLELFDAGGDMLGSDDDGGGALNARIRATLAPGTYRLEASAIGGAGRYRISVSGP